jgi:protein-S-isoprenylcysteine O-methyltransferase Ste14
VSNKPHRPDVHVAPPLVFAGGFIVGYLVHRFWIAINIAGAASGVRPIGLIFVLLGLALALWGVAVFRRAKTTIMPFRASSAVVQDGPYRFTRNPMYVGMTLGYLGASLLFNTAWPMILLPLVLWAMVRLVITREEAFLSATFGSEYDDYRRRVRRWL